MFVLQATIEESTFNNLYHSFPKGEKGRYQKVVADLIKNGASLISDCVTAIQDGVQQGDDGAIMEIIEDMSDDAISVLCGRLKPEEVSIIQTMRGSK